MIVRGIKVGSRSALTAKQDGTVIWNPPIVIPPHNYTWSAGSRVMIAASTPTANLRSSTTISNTTLLATVTLTRQRGTVIEGPVYDVTNTFWWYRVRWDDPTLPNMPTNQGCWVGAAQLSNVVENRAPVATPQTRTATVGTPITITLAGTDADGDALTYTVTVPPTLGTYIGTTYTPTGEGVDSITFRANDGALDSEPATISITNSVSAPPPSGQLSNGVDVTVSGGDDSRDYFTIDATTPIYNLSVRTFGGSGSDVDLYMRLGSQPVPKLANETGGTFDQSSIHSNSNEEITLATPASGTHHVLVHGWYGTPAFSDVTLRATWSTEPPPPPPPTPPPADPVYLSSITRHGITWTFDKTYLCGQYCNYDWWVQGPVKIVAITNQSGVVTPGYVCHGTMINPSAGDLAPQGFDNRVNGTYAPYNAALNVSSQLPNLNVAVDSSVVSCISLQTYTNFRTIDTYAVLTVVATPPGANAFRPRYTGAGSRASTFYKSNLDYTKLAKLTPPASTPGISEVSADFEKLWFEMNMNGTGGRYMHTFYMAANAYGKDMAIKTGNAALLLNLNYTDAQKEELLIRIVQYGLDIYGITQAGATFYDTGGHNCGRLAPLLIAAAALNNNALKAACSQGFSETLQCFFVTQADVNLARYTADGRPRLPYTSANIGMPEWGETHSYNPSRDGNNWNAFYRDICGSQLTAPAMAARVMGLRATVGDEAFFQYQIRHLNYEQGLSGPYGGEFNSNPTPPFHKDFYNAYHNTY